MFTVEQLRPDLGPFTLDSGKCKDSTYVLDYINQARRLLWPRGNFVGTVDTLCVRSYKGLLTLPYDYLKATDMQQCNSFVDIDNEWFEAADNARFDGTCFASVIDLGDRFATFRDYEHPNHRLMIKGERTEDIGKSISFNAINENGNRVSLTAQIGEDHERVTINDWIRYYRSAVKVATVGRVRVYIFDPNRGIEVLCAIYEPDDLAPQYRRYRVPAQQQTQFYVRAKRRYRPLLRETDIVEFSTDALIQACIAITARRNKEIDKYTAALNLAVEAENQTLKDEKQGAGGRIRLSRQRENSNLIDTWTLPTTRFHR